MLFEHVRRASSGKSTASETNGGVHAINQTLLRCGRWPRSVVTSAGTWRRDQSATPIQVVLDQPVSADRTKAGDRFAATVAQPVVVDGNTVIPKGARVSGVVVESRHGGRIKGEADLRLALHSVKVNGTSYPIHTTAFHRSSKSHKRRNLLMIGGGAGTGVLIGALAGGGAGALIGGPVGAGAGTAAAILTNKKDVKLPAETHLTFKLSEPVSIPAKS